MNIVVFLGSTTGNNPDFASATASVGHAIAEGGHRLIFGGTNAGLMKIVCESCLEKGGAVTAIEPDIGFIRKKLHPGVKDVIYTESLGERKAAMVNMGDGFIVMPGGPGTLDEAYDVAALIKVDRLRKPLIFINVDGYYDCLETLHKQMEAEDFMGHASGSVFVVKTAAEAIEIIENYNPGK